ncbi:MAG: tetratricopeptide repeat protein [Pseudomonadota bacterium]
MKRLFILLTAILLSACASVAPPPAAYLFQDQLFSPPGAGVGDAGPIFALTPEMQRYADAVVHGEDKRDRQAALFDALYKKDKLQLEYDSAITRTAAQTFAARRGNCLSLVIMTAALARAMDMSVQYQSVSVEETWSRSGSLYFASGHVNLVLGKNRFDDGRTYDRNKYMIIDFQPPEETKNMVTLQIEEKTVIAMFMNNRAAEALARHELDDAYWWAKQAIAHDPAFVNTYNTLGIVYQHHGNLVQAESALRYAYARQPDSTIAMFNLAQVLESQGRSSEAAALKAQLARLEPNPPFYYFNLGRQAMQEGDYQKARSLFARELERSPYYHEFHFWMAVAAFNLGDLKTADKHMKLALENSATRGDHDLYAAKLDRLKSYERKRATN